MSKKAFALRWLALPIMMLVSFIGMVSPAAAQSTTIQSAIGDQIVTFARYVMEGDFGTSRPDKACFPTPKGKPVNCVQYTWDGGHGSKPGLTLGSCKNGYSGPLPCHANTTVGLDCSGFTRLVYSIAYSKDVFGSEGTASQIKQVVNVIKVPTGPKTAQPGDLVFFAHRSGSIYHVGIYVGGGQMIDSPSTGKFVRQESVSGFISHSTNKVAGYYRYVAPKKPATFPQLHASYSGTVHNVTYNISATYALNSITEDKAGDIAGQAVIGPGLYGSGPFKGSVKADGTISYVITATGAGYTLTFTGKINADKSLSGTYIVGFQNGTWMVK